MEDFKICRAAENDFDGICLLLYQLWPGKLIDRDRIRSVFIEAMRTSRPVYFVARYEEKIIGFMSCLIKNNLWAQGRLLHIDDLVVEKNYRRQKVGTLLMQEAVKFARQSHCSDLELESGFQRTGAHSFYENNGFSKRAFNFIYHLH